MTSLRRFSDGRTSRLLAACSLLGLLSSAVAPPAVRAQTVDTASTVNVDDPSELFLKVYASIQQGEKLEGDSQLRPALAKYRFAASLLEQINQNNPNWQPPIVKYRQRKTAESIQKLEQRIRLQPPADEPASQPAPGNSGGEDNDLPQGDDPLPGGLGNASVNVATPPGRRNMSALTAPPVDETVSRETIDKATRDLSVRLDKSEKALKAALDQLNAAKKDREQAQRKSRELESQMRSSLTDAQLAIVRAERAKADRNEAQQDYDRIQARLKEALNRNPTATETRKELRDQLVESKKALDKANAELKAANKEKEDLTARVNQAEGANVGLIKQRDAALAQSAMTADAANKIAALQAENAALTQKLTAAESQIASLNADSAKKKEEIEGMQKDLTALRDQLVRSRDQNDRAATTITELRKQLDDSATELKGLQAKGAASQEVAQMTKENEILRGIVIRQLKEQARRGQIKKLLTDELARLEVQSKTLTEQVELLGQPAQALSDEERALFKDPQITISDNTPTSGDPASMAFNITAIRPKGPEAAGSPAPSPLTSLTQGMGSVAAAGGGTTLDEATGPKVETTVEPKVAEPLKPKAREANDAFSRGRYVEAEKLYDQLIAREPKNPYLLSNQGVVLFRQNKLKQAEVLLKRAAKTAPSDAFTQATLGIIYYRMHRYDAALECLTKAVRLDPKNATAHNYLGITSSQKGWPEAAEDEISKAIALNPNYADAHFNIAVIYATNQPPSKDRAKEHYQIATELGATPDPTLEKLIKN